MIPDWVWEYWQGVTGGPKPASRIREELVKLTMTHRGQVEMEDSTVESILPDPINVPGMIDFDVDDSPTAIEIERVGACKYCLQLMRKGEVAFWFSEGGRKHLAHPDCWHTLRENTRNET